MRKLKLLTLAVCLFSGPLSAGMTSPQAFMAEYLSNALSLYNKPDKSAFSDPAKVKERMGKAFKLQRMWRRAKNPPLDGQFLNANSGGTCSVKGTEAADTSVKVHVGCTNGDAYYLLKEGRKGLKIQTFSTNPADLMQAAAPAAKSATAKRSKLKRSNPRAQQEGAATPNAQVEAFLDKIAAEMQSRNSGSGGNMMAMKGLAEQTQGLWADERIARRGQARTLSYFLMFVPTAYTLDSADIKGEEATVGLSMDVGNASWKKLKGGNGNQSGLFKLVQRNGKWFLLDFNGSMR